MHFEGDDNMRTMRLTLLGALVVLFLLFEGCSFSAELRVHRAPQFNDTKIAVNPNQEGKTGHEVGLNTNTTVSLWELAAGS